MFFLYKLEVLDLLQYAKESESMLYKARQDGRQNLFNLYANMAVSILNLSFL
jgi:hypothetical protein